MIRDEIFTLANAGGIEVRIIDYGCTIASLRVPDRNGRIDDIVSGFDRAEDYRRSKALYFGIVGRYGNRIAGGRFSLDGVDYALAVNRPPNHLHGGMRGFDKVTWRGEQSGNSVALTYVSADGEEGYPGTLAARTIYSLNDRNEFAIEYEATTDKPTIVNLTNHSLMNLAGQGTRDILDHVLWIDADRYTPVDDNLIPTGELAPVEGTPFDFRTPTAIGARIDDPHPQIARGRGYDHNFVLRPIVADPDRANHSWAEPSGSEHPRGLRRVARIADPSSGRTMEIATTQPGLQVYSGNFLDGSVRGKGGRAYHKRFVFALEAQHFPDSPNHAAFPSTVLRPGETYRSKTVWTFGADG